MHWQLHARFDVLRKPDLARIRHAWVILLQHKSPESHPKVVAPVHRGRWGVPHDIFERAKPSFELRQAHVPDEVEAVDQKLEDALLVRETHHGGAQLQKAAARQLIL